MSTLVLEDVGASTPGEPLRLRFNSGGATDVVFEVSDAGDFVITPDGGDVKLAARTALELAATIGTEVVQVTHLAAGGANVYPIRIDNQFTGSGQNGIHVDYSGATPNNTVNTPFRFEDATALRMELRSNGGIANFQANDVNLCDADLKEVYELVESTWERVRALEVKYFRYKDNLSTRRMIGIMAQNVQRVEPEWFCDRELVDVSARLDGKGKRGPPRQEQRPRMIFSQDIEYAVLRTVQELQDRVVALEGQ